MKTSLTLYSKNKTPLLYLGAPYSDSNPYITAIRVLPINHVVAELFKRNIMVFSPISHCHAVAQLSNLDGSYETWKHYNLLMIRKCEHFGVLELHNHWESKGLKAEWDYARSIGKPCFRITPMIEVIPMPPIKP